MNSKDSVLEQLKAMEVNPQNLAGIGWWRFELDGSQMLCISSNDSLGMVRFCIPYLNGMERSYSSELAFVVNEVNREIRHVKIII